MFEPYNGKKIKSCSPLVGEPESQEGVPSQASRGGMVLAVARRLRKEPTDAEARLWRYLRYKQFGVKFRRQQPIGNYVVDFVSFDVRLVIELDGGQHADKRKAYDTRRNAWLKEQGFTVLRFWNHEVMENIDGVRQAIALAVKSLSSVEMSADRSSLPTRPLSHKGGNNMEDESSSYAQTNRH